jgi:hypothetical protein
MAKDRTLGDGNRAGAERDRSGVQAWVKRDSSAGRRQILFPTEPSTIGHKKIDRAIERVVSRKK